MRLSWAPWGRPQLPLVWTAERTFIWLPRLLLWGREAALTLEDPRRSGWGRAGQGIHCPLPGTLISKFCCPQGRTWLAHPLLHSARHTRSSFPIKILPAKSKLTGWPPHGNHPALSLQARSHPGQHWLFQLCHPGFSECNIQDGLLAPVNQPGPGEGSLSNQGYLNNWSNSPEREGHVSTSQLGVEMPVEVSGYSRNCWCPLQVGLPPHPQPLGVLATRGLW